MTMVMWIIGGYVLTAVAFYSYIVATAQEEPQERSGVVIDLADWKRKRDANGRKAA